MINIDKIEDYELNELLSYFETILMDKEDQKKKRERIRNHKRKNFLEACS